MVMLKKMNAFDKYKTIASIIILGFSIKFFRQNYDVMTYQMANLFLIRHIY